MIDDEDKPPFEGTLGSGTAQALGIVGISATKRDLRDYLTGSYYSAIEFDPKQRAEASRPWELFSYCRSQAMPECGKSATSVHTNLPRSGSNGLPQGWEAWITGWRARLSRVNPVIEQWAAKTVASFKYREKLFYMAPLSELLRGEPLQMTWDDTEEMLKASSEEELAAVRAKFGTNIVRVQENLSYKVELYCDDVDAMRDFREHLREGVGDPEAKIVWNRLDVTAAYARDEVAVAEIRRAQRKLMPLKNPPLTLWVFLDGVMTKPVV